MKRFYLICIFTTIAVLLLLALYIKGPSEQYNAKNVSPILPGTLPRDFHEYRSITEDGIGANLIANSKHDLVLHGVANKESEIELVKSMEKPDGTSFLILFRIQNQFGSTFVIMIDKKTGTITQRFSIPDA